MSSNVSSPEPVSPLRTVVFIGGGGHAAVCLDVFRSTGREVRGYLAPQASELDIPHLGVDDDLHAIADAADEVFVAIGSNAVRLRILRELLAAAVPVATCASASSVVSPSARLGTGTIVMPGAVINARSVIGDGVIINTSASVDHDGVIGDGAHVAPGSHLAGNVTVGERTFLGAGTIVIPGRKIGAAVTTGAGAVVVTDLEAPGTYVGVPAKRRGGPA